MIPESETRPLTWFHGAWWLGHSGWIAQSHQVRHNPKSILAWYLNSPSIYRSYAERAIETWDFQLVKHPRSGSVHPVGDKSFHAYLNRNNIFGKCKHKETQATSQHCGCLKRTQLHVCIDCSTLLTCQNCTSGSNWMAIWHFSTKGLSEFRPWTDFDWWMTLTVTVISRWH